MAKASFTSLEMSIWNSIYGPSRGPSTGRLKILVEEFAALGLLPVMMRVRDDMLPYDAEAFRTALLEAFRFKENDLVQVYYLPQECERVVGSSASTWVQWGQNILARSGLLPETYTDKDPVILENVPRLRLPVAAREALYARNLTTSSVCTLLSARVVAFFIAAQYEAWRTSEQVVRVTPFKDVLSKLGFSVRVAWARTAVELDALVSELVSAFKDKPEPKAAPLPLDVGTPQDINFDQELAEIAEELHTSVEQEQPPMETRMNVDIDQEIAAAEERLRVLREQKYQMQRKDVFLRATVVDAIFDEHPLPRVLDLRLPNGSSIRYFRDAA